LILEQGDNYTEYSVQVKDQNKEDRKSRRIQISYSPEWDMDRVGEYQVTYTLSTNWTMPGSTSVTRIVKVNDLDEW